MKKYIIALSLLVTTSAEAAQMGVAVGYRLNDADTSTVGASVDGKGTFQVGGLAYFPLADKLELRTGIFYSQRYFEYKTASGTEDHELAYADIPATVLYKFMEYGGIFGGLNLGLKMADDCGSVDCDGVKSTITPFVFGVYFMAAPQIAAEIYFETTSGKLTDDLEDASALGVNAIITFE